VSAPYGDAWKKILPVESIEPRQDYLMRKSIAVATVAPEQSPASHVAPGRVLTSVASRGHVRLRAVFGPGWQTSDAFGLLLHATATRGYEFRIQRAAPLVNNFSAATAATLHEVVLEGAGQEGRMAMAILRDGHLLRTAFVDAAEFAGDTLPVEAQVEGRQITFKVGGRRALSFDDVLGSPGEPDSRFGLIWPAQLGIVSLEGFNQALPVEPSPLEEGDELFVAQQWDEALAKYRTQAAQAQQRPQIEHAQYKAALCLVKLNRLSQAKESFERLATTGDEQVKLLASCQLWLLAVRSQRFDEAQIVFQHIQSRYSFEELALLVSEEDRNRMVRGIYDATMGFNMFRFSERELAFLEQAHTVADLFDQQATVDVRNSRAWQMLRAYHLCGQADAALAVGEKYLAQFSQANAAPPLDAVEEMSWILRVQGRHGEALDLLNRFLNPSDASSPVLNSLLVERARVHAAQERWQESAQDLDAYLADPAARERYTSFANACLMRGFLHVRAGDDAAASAIWRRGAYHEWSKDLQSKPRLTGMGATSALLLAALIKELTPEKFNDLYASPMSSVWGGAEGELFRQYVPMVSSAASEIAEDDFGREALRQLSFKEMPLEQYVRAPIALILLKLSEQGAAADKWNHDEASLIWELLHDALEEYQHKRLGKTQAVQFLLTWKGANNAFGWQGLSAALPPRIRCRAAYMYGHRFKKLGRPKDAMQFFRTALADADPDSPLAKLAKLQIDLLQAP
jgi:tetratricopeptide (TPR) repeat protein